MIGRATELRRLRDLLGLAGPQVAVVAGEPGVGKSRLVHELISLVSPTRAVLIGQADPGDLGRPFELLLDALDGASEAGALRLAPISTTASPQRKNSWRAPHWAFSRSRRRSRLSLAP